MYLFDLGKLPAQQSMLIFQALARIGIGDLLIVSPKNPLASIGYFQDAAMEVELRKTQFEEGEVRNKIQRFYEEHRIQAPGVLPEDFATAIVKSQPEGSK